MTFLATRTPRERILIYIGGGLVVFFAMWQFAINPILSSKARADIKSIAAQRDLDIVTKGVARMGKVESAPRLPFDLPVIVTAAQAQGLVITRTQPGREGALRLWFANANANDIYRFLETATHTYQLSIGRVQMTRSVTGKVDADVTLIPST